MAIDTLNHHVHYIPGGVEIKNEGIFDIVLQTKGIIDEINWQTKTSLWPYTVAWATANAFNEEHWQKTVDSFERWCISYQGRKMMSEIDDVDSLLNSKLRVTDMPEIDFSFDFSFNMDLGLF
eukprot:CAMPEP_0168615076 /NCGR_PEP_ID=MMETSP0449_2-20121227/4314_1 /TAXON_ID=1082188 /ORGANISM="Strombidium rassoulzadegani, Strain ras09" /LENGTH=121 /DNA_ID=CAMNT_0008655797 /DNA_START=585 /DNA_END=950 /DNA_ORIENTATION=+